MCGNFFNPSSPSFLGGGVGQTVAEAGLGAVGLPELAAGIGGAAGGFGGGNGFNPVGAVTGGLGGYGAGSLGGSLATNGIGGTIDNIWNGISNGASSASDWASNLWNGGGGTPAGSTAFSTPVGSDMFTSGLAGANPMDPDYLKKLGMLQGPGTTGGYLTPGIAPTLASGGFPASYPAAAVPAAAAGVTGARGLNGLTSIGSGLYGLNNSNQMRQMAQQQGQQADPWGSSGGRAASAAQLAALNADPTAAMAADPRYAAMVQAAQRGSAMYGQGSGNMAIAAAGAGGNWYGQRLQELGGLAGIGNAAIGANATLQGTQNANNLAGDSLASIGYGVNTMTGGSAMSNMPPQVRAWLQQQGMMG
jgi:hypothetical protein